MLLSTRHRRRRELATLSSLGLTTRGLRNCVVWQSLGVVAVSAVLGIVAGVAGGAAIWIATTGGIGVATDVNRPLAVIGVWTSVALAAAVLLGTIAGARAARLDVAQSLRHE
jgi:ABC-type antimicrobial peptide transport system permease subunit